MNLFDKILEVFFTLVIACIVYLLITESYDSVQYFAWGLIVFMCVTGILINRFLRIK